MICSPAKSRQHGLSLVELLIALFMGLMIVLAVISLYLANKNSFLYQETNSRLLEDGRFIVDTIAYDLRNASYSGCGVVSTTTNVVTGFDANWTIDNRNMIRGFNETTGFPAEFVAAAAQGDVLIVMYRDSESELEISAHDVINHRITLGANHAFAKGEILYGTDCKRDAVFQMSGPDSAGTPTNLVEHAAGLTSPGNCQGELGTSCGITPVTAYTFSAGGFLSRLISKAYFVAPASSGTGNSLYVRSPTGSTTATATNIELMTDVQAMRIRYGLDLDCDGVSDRFASANEVAATPLCNPDQSSPWQLVVSARIEVLLLGQPGVTSENQPFCLDYLGTGDPAQCTAANYGYVFTTSNREAGRVFSTTVALRNRVG